MDAAVISTERLFLRSWQPTDTAPFIAMNKDEAVMKHFPKLSTDEETIAMIGRINNHFYKNGFGLYAVEHKVSGDFMGFTGFSIPTFDAPFMPCVEIGWRFATTFWGHGFATEAAKACLRYGFEKLNFDEVLSFTTTTNTNSEKVMQRIGMKFTDTFYHPDIDKGHPLCKNVLYKIEKPANL